MRPTADQERRERRRKLANRIIIAITVLGVLGVSNYWRNGGLWGISDAMIQIRLDPLANKNLLGYNRCEVREEPGGLLGAIPQRATWYAPTTEPNEETLQQAVNYALNNGWTEVG